MLKTIDCALYEMTNRAVVARSCKAAAIAWVAGICGAVLFSFFCLDAQNAQDARYKTSVRRVFTERISYTHVIANYRTMLSMKRAREDPATFLPKVEKAKAEWARVATFQWTANKELLINTLQGVKDAKAYAERMLDNLKYAKPSFRSEEVCVVLCHGIRGLIVPQATGRERTSNLMVDVVDPAGGQAFQVHMRCMACGVSKSPFKVETSLKRLSSCPPYFFAVGTQRTTPLNGNVIYNFDYEYIVGPVLPAEEVPLMYLARDPEPAHPSVPVTFFRLEGKAVHGQGDNERRELQIFTGGTTHDIVLYPKAYDIAESDLEVEYTFALVGYIQVSGRFIKQNYAQVLPAERLLHVFPQEVINRDVNEGGEAEERALF